MIEINASVILVALRGVGESYVGVGYIRNTVGRQRAVCCGRNGDASGSGNFLSDRNCGERPQVIAESEGTVCGGAIGRGRRSESASHDAWGNSRQAEELVRQAPRPHLMYICSKLGSFYPLICKSRVIPAQAFVGEEEEQLVFHDWPTQAAAKETLLGIHALRTLSGKNLLVVLTCQQARRNAGWPIELVEGVESFVVKENHAAAVQGICAVLRNDLHLRSGVATVLCGIAAGHDLDLAHGLLTRSYDRRTTQTEAVYADAINLKVVAGDALAVGADLGLIFCLEDSSIGRPTQGFGAGQERGSVAGTSTRAISQNARRQAQQFVGIAANLRKPLNVGG